MNKKMMMFTFISCIAFSLSLKGCPYTFENDTDKTLMVSDKVNGTGQEIKPGEKKTIEAPIATEADKDKQYPGNGHAPEYVYIKENDKWHHQFKIIEMACGQGSVIKASQLGDMSDGKIDSGRFLIKRNDQERRTRKHSQLSVKSMRS
jgi:hypothetical protein